MSGKNIDKTSDAARSDPQVADENHQELAKQAEQKVSEADRNPVRENSDASR